MYIYIYIHIHIYIHIYIYIYIHTDLQLGHQVITQPLHETTFRVVALPTAARVTASNQPGHVITSHGALPRIRRPPPSFEPNAPGRGLAHKTPRPGAAGAAAGGASDAKRARREQQPQPGVFWPLQDIRLLRVLCAQINRPFIPSTHLHCPHCCNTVARLSSNMSPPL